MLNFVEALLHGIAGISVEVTWKKRAFE